MTVLIAISISFQASQQLSPFPHGASLEPWLSAALGHIHNAPTSWQLTLLVVWQIYSEHCHAAMRRLLICCWLEACGVSDPSSAVPCVFMVRRLPGPNLQFCAKAVQVLPEASAT